MSPRCQRFLLPAKPPPTATRASRKRTLEAETDRMPLNDQAAPGPTQRRRLVAWQDLARTFQPKSSTRPLPSDTGAKGEASAETANGYSDSPEPTAQRGLCRRA